LELRDARGGDVVRELLAPRYVTLQASTAANGDVVAAAESPRCHVGIYRINPASGAAKLLRVIDDNVIDFAVSPDGRRVAFLTTRPCVRSSTHGGGAVAGVGPQTLVVLDLASGARVTATDSAPNHSLVSVVFSPSGDEIATTYRSDGSIHVLSADHPDLAHARVFTMPGRCGYLIVTWGQSGLYTIAGCGVSPLLDPGLLLELNRSGRRVRSWTLPTCVNGIGLATDATRRHVYLQLGIGHGSIGDECSRDWSQRLLEIEPSRLRPVIESPGMQQTYELTG
jgi:WD40 repeat protein